MLAEVSPLSVAIFALEIVFAMGTNSAFFASFLASTLFNTVDTNAPSLAYLAVVFPCTMLAHGSLFPLCLPSGFVSRRLLEGMTCKENYLSVKRESASAIIK